MGTEEELAAAESYYKALEGDDDVKYVYVSRPYKNRGSNTLFRLYVEIEYKSIFFYKKLVRLQGGINYDFIA